MGAFWNSWQLWEKLCFVMGAAIVLVIIAGIFKLIYTHWRLRKYTALAKTKAAQKADALQRAPSAVRRKKGNDIPFGVRAIESGIEVDGVWISRSNTPANSTPGSPALSASKEPDAKAAPVSEHASSASNLSRLEIPQPALGHHRPNAKSTNSAHIRASGNPFERPISSERSPSRLGSSYSELTPRGRPTYQPRRSSHLRYSNSNAGDHADALATLEGRQLASKTGSKSSQESAVSEPSDQRISNDSWSGSSGGSNGQHTGQSQGVKQPSNGLLQPVPIKPSTTRYRNSEVDSQADYRRSHAAETGQLFPRVRVSDGANEWAGVQQPAEHRNYLSDRSSSPMGLGNDPFATPQTTPLMTPSREASSEAPSFEEFVRSTSPQGRYYLGEEGIPMQPQLGDGHSDRNFSPGSTSQSVKRYRNEHDKTGRKASSFSEAV